MVKRSKQNARKRNNDVDDKNISGTNKIIHDAVAVFGIVCIIIVILLVIVSNSEGVEGIEVFNKIIDSVKHLFGFA